MSAAYESKILDRSQLAALARQWRTAGEKIILTNGCFDVLHVGHIRCLHAAKALGGKLVVALNSASSARTLKGEGRPRVPAPARAEMLAALHDVAATTIVAEGDVCRSVQTLCPDM